MSYLYRTWLYWWNYAKYAYSRHPSWRIIYPDIVSIPLCREDARFRAKLFDGRVVYSRDYRGDLLPAEHFLPEAPAEDREIHRNI